MVNNMKKYILNILVITLFIIAISRICYLMFYKSEYYKNIYIKNSTKIIYGSSAPRGRIIDRNGNIIVDNVGVKTIIYNKLSGISEKEEIDIAMTLATNIDVNIGNESELKYFYYINNKNKINNFI